MELAPGPDSLKGVGKVLGFKIGYDEWVSGGWELDNRKDERSQHSTQLKLFDWKIPIVSLVDDGNNATLNENKNGKRRVLHNDIIAEIETK